MANVGIKDSWSLIAFARQHGGNPQLADFVNKTTGEQFKSLVFTNSDGSRVLVSFSEKLSPLTVAQIAQQKNDLQVVELNSGNYKLCKQSENTWETVDLGL